MFNFIFFYIQSLCVKFTKDFNGRNLLKVLGPDEIKYSINVAKILWTMEELISHRIIDEQANSRKFQNNDNIRLEFSQPEDLAKVQLLQGNVLYFIIMFTANNIYHVLKF